MKNHLEEVHQLNGAYMGWIFLHEDRISELEATSTRMNCYSVRGPDLPDPSSATLFWNRLGRPHEYPSDSVASGVKQTENFVGFLCTGNAVRN